MGRVLSLNISDKRGVAKQTVLSVMVTETGIAGDAHSGNWHRQVSLLPGEQVNAFEAELGRPLAPGEFGENITVEGVDFSGIAVRDQLHLGSVVLEVTQIGKRCHGEGCAIYTAAGKCIMPSMGVFCRVIRGGPLYTGDKVSHVAKPVRVMVITLSDRAHKGEYEDRSGPEIVRMLARHFKSTRWQLSVNTAIIGDDADRLREMVAACAADKVDVLITTGGTGIGKRDITPETLTPLLEREIPGIMDFIRNKYGATLPQALVSRSVAGTIGEMQVFALPGSVKAAREYMHEILLVVEHNMMMLWGIDSHE